MKLSFLHWMQVVAALALTACAKGEAPQQNQLKSQMDPQLPIVHASQVRVVDGNRPSVAPGVGTSHSVEVMMTVDRDALLNQEFLYGADLQYSSLFDSSMNLYNQSMAIGHIPVKFRIVGNQLQLIADNKRLYPSDVNHPEELLSRFDILDQNNGVPATLTISGAKSELALSKLFSGAIGDAAKSREVKDSWVRSFDYSQEGNFVLQQTSVSFSDGTIAEFMESFFPRATLKPGESFQKFEMSPDSLVGAFEGPAARFRWLPGEKIFEGEKAVSYAEHFDITKNLSNPNGTIDFYVTSNIPDAYLLPVQEAVEGWNRYFLHFKGIERAVLQFKGRLPDGIYLGDPRYNVINWDNRKVAGAAYETQAADPSTGRQSHSIVYMPAAWVQIGNNYWNEGRYSDASSNVLGNVLGSGLSESVSPMALKKRGGVSSSARLACARDIRDSGEVLASGRLSDDEMKVFGVQLLKQTLFHEIGHSLGLHHNFKGSLSFDRSNSKSVFSSSIMDYNDFEAERGAFSAVDSSDGPQLEYDRQAVSALYNRGIDIQSTDPWVPACNDAEADQVIGGVDPFCIRYDLGSDPTQSVETAYSRIIEPSLTGDISLTEALQRVGLASRGSERIQEVQTQEDLDAYLAHVSRALQGVMRFYFLSGKESLLRTVILNLKSMLVFEESILPIHSSEMGMRERAFVGVSRLNRMTQLPQTVLDTCEQIGEDVILALGNSPFLKSFQGQDRNRISHTAKGAWGRMIGAFESDEFQGLPKMRATLFQNLKRFPDVPLYLGKVGLLTVDFESAVMALLTEAVVSPSRTVSERLAAAASLISYKGRLTMGDSVIQRVMNKIVEQRDQATDSRSRETAERVLGALLGG